MSAQVISLHPKRVTLSSAGDAFEVECRAAVARLRDAIETIRAARRSLAGVSRQELESARAVVAQLMSSGDLLVDLLDDIDDVLEAPRTVSSTAREQAIRTGHPCAT